MGLGQSMLTFKTFFYPMYFLPNRILCYCHTIVNEKIPLMYFPDFSWTLGGDSQTQTFATLGPLVCLFLGICIICKYIDSTQAWIRALKSKEDSLCCTFAEF